MVGSRRTLKVCVATLENVGDKEGFSAATAEDLLGEVLDGGLPGFSSSAINNSSVMSMGSSFAKINPVTTILRLDEQLELGTLVKL